MVKFNIQSEVNKIARESENSSNISLSHLCNDDRKVHMTHLGQLKFIIFDITKPLFYSEMVKITDNYYSLITKQNNPLAIAYDYPYIESKESDKWVAETCGAYKTGDYFLMQGIINKTPDYHRIEGIIFDALNKINNLKF